VSVPEPVLSRWPAKLEERHLITGAMGTGELRAVITSAGRELLDAYLSATNDLQVSAHQ
jgi:hypothetical protein